MSEDVTLSNAELAKAFPSDMREEALAVVSQFPASNHDWKPFSVRVRHEEVLIPCRIYHDPSQIKPRNSSTQALIAACLLSRHYDGFVRQRYLKKIIESREDWVPPFVIQLSGEYVVEIIAVIHTNLQRLDRTQYRTFLQTNSEFLAKTAQRVRSYWDCYYRHRYTWEGYPGNQIMAFFAKLVETT